MPYLPLDLARNPIAVAIPFPAGHPAPETLRYLAEIWVPQAPDSATYTRLAVLEAAHRPPAGGLYADAVIHLEDYLARQFPPQPPTGQEAEPFERLVRLPGAVLPWYVRYRRTPHDPAWIQLPTRFALQAGLDFPDAAGMAGAEFTTDVLPLTRQFLTWQPAVKSIQPGQPEYLDFLCHNTAWTQLRLKVRAGGAATATTAATTAAAPNQVYRCAVGPHQLGLAPSVTEYQVWLEDQAGAAVSETRTYRLDPAYRRNLKFLLFRNSLGGYDTLCCTGRSRQVLAAKADTVQRFPQVRPGQPDARTPADGEFEVAEIDGEQTLEVSTGHLPRATYDWLEELYLSEQIYLLGPRGATPCLLAARPLPTRIDDEAVLGVRLTLKALWRRRLYTRLPDLTYTATRSHTAACAAPFSGPQVTRTATATSTASPADAAAKAAARARALAESALVCTLPADGAYLGTACKPATTELWTLVADGAGGERYGILIDAQAAQCGYLPPVAFSITALGGGSVTIEDLRGGDPAAGPYEYSWNGGATWLPVPDGTRPGQALLPVPLDGSVPIAIRRGAAGTPRASQQVQETYITPSNTGQVQTLRATKGEPGLAANQVRLSVERQGFLSPAELRTVYWVRYRLDRSVPGSSDVTVAAGWFDLNAPADDPSRTVTLDNPAATYYVVFAAGTRGTNRYNSLVTLP